jgi:hypothetical protein
LNITGGKVSRLVLTGDGGRTFGNGVADKGVTVNCGATEGDVQVPRLDAPTINCNPRNLNIGN